MFVGMLSVLFTVPAQASSLLQYGDKGDEVTKLQERLGTLGFYVGNIDGIFGRETEWAVKLFQQAADIEDDGVVGQVTWNALRGAKPVVSRYRTGSLLVQQII